MYQDDHVSVVKMSAMVVRSKQFHGDQFGRPGYWSNNTGEDFCDDRVTDNFRLDTGCSKQQIDQRAVFFPGQFEAYSSQPLGRLILKLTDELISPLKHSHGEPFGGLVVFGENCMIDITGEARSRWASI